MHPHHQTVLVHLSDLGVSYSLVHGAGAARRRKVVRLLDEEADLLLGLLVALLVQRRDRHHPLRARLVDVDVDELEVFDQRPDHRSPRPNHLADGGLGDGHGEHLGDGGCEGVGRLLLCLQHVVQHVQPPLLRLGEGALEEVDAEALALDVQLERRDTLRVAGHLEIHGPEPILEPQDVGQDHSLLIHLHSHVLVAALEIVGEQQAHRHARHRALDRHAGVKQRERSAADRGHARGSTALGDQ
mmetsp:Transcript_46856/g.111133  ORF Transcript_46856/g.111133 Transcript_46856/m.111133 type:complete len:243 (-) Transcript_46856:1815-2543(-)